MKITTTTVTCTLGELSLALDEDSSTNPFLCGLVVGMGLHDQRRTVFDNIDVNVLEVFCREFPDICRKSFRTTPTLLEHIVDCDEIDGVAYQSKYIVRKFRRIVLDELISRYGSGKVLNFILTTNVG